MLVLLRGSVGSRVITPNTTLSVLIPGGILG
jgi:hypothetical protein